jgi:hypothetical protein
MSLYRHMNCRRGGGQSIETRRVLSVLSAWAQQPGKEFPDVKMGLVGNSHRPQNRFHDHKCLWVIEGA